MRSTVVFTSHTSHTSHTPHTFPVAMQHSDIPRVFALGFPLRKTDDTVSIPGSIPVY